MKEQIRKALKEFGIDVPASQLHEVSSNSEFTTFTANLVETDYSTGKVANTFDITARYYHASNKVEYEIE